ncbi:hypothetical protein I553_0479 [Mycobacterium xenopi 4042]|uniref:Uncharacterized protein n=1 Tax=Mycobacterium xenopi 4042 TaxID=1299334 RepID=X7YJV7_MYCXE|nr:hypothetical protein I553_0479 [Mycobacterium xenopi 4042]
MFAHPKRVDSPVPKDGLDDNPDAFAAEPTPAKRPPRWSMRNWPVRWKVVAIALVPLVLAMVFGGLRIYAAMTDASNLRLAADRAQVVPAITKYMSALDVAVIATSTGSDVEGPRRTTRPASTSCRHGWPTPTWPRRSDRVGTLLNGGQALLDKIAANSIGLRDRVTMYAPILLTAENAVDGSVRVDNTQIRAAAQGLSRAIGARGQMMMQRLLITRGGDLPEPELRTSMITLAGTEPSTLFGMAEILASGRPRQRRCSSRWSAGWPSCRIRPANWSTTRAAALCTDHRRDRRTGDQGHHRLGDEVARRSRQQSSRRRDPRRRAGAGRLRGGAGGGLAGGTVADPAAAGAARQRFESRAQRPRRRDRPGPRRRRACSRAAAGVHHGGDRAGRARGR